MTAPLPENIRRAGYDALEELSTRMFRGAASLLRHALRFRLDDAKAHREALAQLRRYQGFKMPCFEEVAVIEGAMLGLTEPESRALSERRRMKQLRREEDRKKQAQAWEKQHSEVSRQAAPISDGQVTNERLAFLASAIHASLESTRALETLAAEPHQDGNVITGPWDTGGEARP